MSKRRALRQPVPFLLITGIVLLLVALGTRVVIAKETVRRRSLGAQNFCTCPDCTRYYVWSPEADEIYGFPLSLASEFAAALRQATIGCLGLGLGTAALRLASPRPKAADPRCRACGYALTGLPAGAVCPECGTPARPRTGTLALRGHGSPGWRGIDMARDNWVRDDSRPLVRHTAIMIASGLVSILLASAPLLLGGPPALAALPLIMVTAVIAVLLARRS